MSTRFSTQLVTILVLSFSVMNPFARAEVQHPRTVSCDDYQTYLTEQSLSASQREFQTMRQEVLGLCHESWFTGEANYLKQYGKYAWKGVNLSIIPDLSERIEHDGLSLKVYDILNYPRLGQILQECYPGNSIKAKFERWNFKRTLSYDNQLAYVKGTAAGVIIPWVGPMVLTRYFKTLPIAIRASEYMKSLPAVARIASMRAWVVETFPFVTTSWGKVTIWFTGVAGGIAAYVGWEHISPDASGAPVRVSDQPAAAMPLQPASSSPSSTGNPSAMNIIDGITSTNLFATDVTQVQTYVASKVQQYGNDRGKLPLIDPADELSTEIDITKQSCIDSISDYKRDPSVGNLNVLKENCDNYFDNVHAGMDQLQFPSVRCLAVNTGFAHRTMNDLKSVIHALPPAALIRR